MTTRTFYEYLVRDFPYALTSRQQQALEGFARFIMESNPDGLFLLKGYAGTGKTTLISTLVTNLYRVKQKALVLAPTGRAAKVISSYSGKQAHTIHRMIYAPNSHKGGGMSFDLKTNKYKNTLFIVDESSMIPDAPSTEKAFENGALLDDLMTFVYQGDGCRLMLVGDEAQLPPVHSDLSPALDYQRLSNEYYRQVAFVQLNEVVRQAQESGILVNATQIREQIAVEAYEFLELQTRGYPDIVRLQESYQTLDALNDCFTGKDQEDSVIIVRSNKRANLYNQQIRARILFQEDVLSAGDLIMVVKNNYYWLSPKSPAGFIANGDILRVRAIQAFKELYGFQFAEVTVEMVDYPGQPEFDTVVLLDTLTMEHPSLPYEEANRLYTEVSKDYTHLSKYKMWQEIKDNRYFNALQIKFSYAITCHKSQGGQWKNVFVEQPYLPDGISKAYLRWLYTAITRAQEQLYLIGFANHYFREE